MPRESSFIKKTTIVDSDFVRLFSPGLNFAVGFSDFKIAMGITVDLSSVGNPSGNPVMFTDGTAFKFRAIESGSGIIAQLSPLNGIEIGLNLTQDVTGAPIFDDVGAIKPTVASIIPGNGISVTKINDTIRITSVTSPVSSKTVTVSSLSDLPTPVGGIITLAASTDYLFLQDITTPDRFDVSNAVVVRAADSSIIKLTYTGSDTMFTATDASLKIEKIRLDCPTGTLFNITGTAPGTVFQMDDMTVTSCDVIGSLNNVTAVQIGNTAFDDIKTNGITFSGNTPVFIMERDLFNQNGGKSLDLGTATFDGITAVTLFVTLAAGTTFLSGLIDSGNIMAGGLGTLFNTRFSGAGVPLENISEDDALWDFFSNDQVPNTRTDALLSMQGNAVNTVISVAGTPVLVAGSWVVERTSQMSGTSGGRATLNTGKPAPLPITLAVTVAPVSGGTINVSVFVAINGVAVANSKKFDSASSGAPTSITVPWQESLNPTDFVEVFVANDDTGVDLLVSSAILRVN